MNSANVSREILSRTISHRFRAIVAAHPDKAAITDPRWQWSYAELGGHVARIAARLSHLGPGPIAILIGNDVYFAAAFLGILEAGRIAIPLDPEHPDDRIRQITDHASATAVVTTGAYATRAREALGPGVTVVDIDVSSSPFENAPINLAGPDDVACVLYTSGSTGAAKGVALTHRMLLHAVLVLAESFALTSDDKLCVFYSFVVGGLRNYLAALLTGASVHVLPPKELKAGGIAREILVRGITVYQSVPTLFRRVAEALPTGVRFDSLRIVRLMGDRIEWQDFDHFRQACGENAQFSIALGSTEASMYAAWFVDSALRGSTQRPPVGYVTHDFVVEVVDDNERPLPEGVVGEFAVLSNYLALAYWNDPAATDRAFQTGTEGKPQRFLTGDMGLRRPDGLLEFVGRKDRLVKLRGHRIEPAEIEAALTRCAHVVDAAVVVRRNPEGDARAIVAYAELEPGTRGLLPRHLLALLSQKVPSYMVPSALFVLDHLPRLSNLKIDRVALADRDSEVASGSERAGDEVLDGVATIFEKVIGCRSATADDNIFSLGGDSLQSVNILLELEQRFGVAIHPAIFERTRDIRELAQAVRAHIAARRSAAPLARKIAKLKTRVKAVMPASLVAELATRFWCAAPVGGRKLAKSTILAKLLIARGELDDAKKIVQDVHAADPHFEWANNLMAYFDGLPQPDTQLAAPTGSSDDVQLYRRLDCDTVLLCFTAGMYLPPTLLHRWLGNLPANILYLRDSRKLCYLGGVASLGDGLQASLTALAALIDSIGATRILCFGSCSGGFGALRYGLALRAEAVLALAPMTNLAPTFTTYLSGARNSVYIASTVPQEPLDLHPLFLAERPPRTTLVYGSEHWDSRLQCEHMRATGVDLHPVEGCANRNVLPMLIPSGTFAELLGELAVPTGSRTAIRR
ncbi:MAG: non-ribosomal peptide synthetase [Rhizomicrobium sp.]|nr:non-ribosomal peptide synthetase [Rhizomicrobium sp.]